MLYTRNWAAVFNYLKATGYDLALLVNFGENQLKMKRLFKFMKKSSDNSVVCKTDVE